MPFVLVFYLLPLLINGSPVPERAFYEINKGADLIYGDIVMTEHEKMIQQLPKEARMAFFIKNSGYNRWPNNVVPYEISGQFSGSDRTVIETALKELEQKTCFKFPRRTNEQDYVQFEIREGCNSPLGRVGGQQVISLGTNCVQNYVVIHETMHSMGMHHEHQRNDRDKYVDVNLENVDPSNRQWLETAGNAEYETNGFGYDLLSIMHYQGTAFGKKIQQFPYIATTMTYKGTNTPIPVNRELTNEDIKKIQFLGGCSSNKGGPADSKRGSKKSRSNRNKNKKRRGRRTNRG